MNWLSTLIFFFISGMGFFYLLTNKTFVLSDVLDKQRQFVADGNQYLLLFIMATGIAACGNWMVYRLLVSIAIVFFALFINKNKLVFSWTVTAYLLFLCWMVVAISYSPVKIFGLRVFMKYLFPILIMLFATKLMPTAQFYLKVLRVILVVSLFGVLCYLGLGRIPVLGSIISSFIFWGPGILDFFPVSIAISFALFSYTKKLRYLIYILLFVLSSVLSINRTGLLAASITIVVFAVVRYKIKSLPYVVLGVGILLGTILYVPAFRQKMFKKQLTSDEIIERGESLSEDDIDSSGRFAMWEWSKKQYYEGHEWMGSGLGVLQARFYSLNHPFGSIRIVHNDYLQLMCDTGLIGLSLYILIMVSFVIHSFIIYFNKRKIFVVRFAALIAGVSLTGMASTLYTDNVVNYTLMTLTYPYALYGIMLALNKRYAH